MGWGRYEEGCNRDWAWSHFCGTVEGLWFSIAFIFFLRFIIVYVPYSKFNAYFHSQICNWNLLPLFFIFASIYYWYSLHLLDLYRTHIIRAETVDLLSLSIIIMHVQNTQGRRCRTHNLSLTKMPQLWAGLTLKMQNPQLLLRSSILYLPLAIFSIKWYVRWCFIWLSIYLRFSFLPISCSIGYLVQYYNQNSIKFPLVLHIRQPRWVLESSLHKG